MAEDEAMKLVLEAFDKCGMIQGGYEARDFAVWLSSRDIADILELGTCSGGTMYLIDKACKPGLRISMDMPWDERDPKVPDGWEQRVKGYLPHMIEIIGNIHNQLQAARLAGYLGQRKLDLIFADADHSYAGAKKHFEMYSPFLRPGGYFAMHDVANGHQCQQWWEQEIKPKYETWIFTEQTNLYGIGVAQL